MTASDEVVLTTDQIDDAILKIVLSGPSGPQAGLTLARIAGRSIKALNDIVGTEEALVTLNTLLSQVKKGSLQ